MNLNIMPEYLKARSTSFYCICSNLSFDDIANLQRQSNLSFLELISTATRCQEGCGSCIEKLRDYLKNENLISD